MNVYEAISAVAADLSREGIAKSRRNTQGSGYNFRGIDDVYNALAIPMAKHGLVVLPRIIERELVERQSKAGGALFYVTVTAEFDFVSAKDGSKHTVRTYGEAMDSADKGTNKAMSAAYKYACMMAFCIPTEGVDNDADETTHEVKPSAQKATLRPVRDLPAAPADEPPILPSEHAAWIGAQVRMMAEATDPKELRRLLDNAKAHCTTYADIDGYQAIKAAATARYKEIHDGKQPDVVPA